MPSIHDYDYNSPERAVYEKLCELNYTMNEVLSVMREAQSGERSDTHHVIKEAVRTAILEAVNALKSPNEGFIEYLLRKGAANEAKRDNPNNTTASGADILFRGRATNPRMVPGGVASDVWVNRTGPETEDW